MNWRGLHLSEPAKLSVRQNQLLLEREDGRYTFPLEDLAFLIFDTQRITLSASTLASCANNGCLVISCDNRHMPCGALLPYHSFHRHTETLLSQISMTEPRKKKLWKDIVCRKIHNQATCLSMADCHENQILKVAVLESKVKSGDPNNIESLAARLYWHYWRTGFSRNQDAEDRINIMLNYGYSLVRALIARELSARGFTPSLGLHHHSISNAFNLADDILEPWRPFVDNMVLEHLSETSNNDDFSLDNRRHLAKIFYKNVDYDGEIMTLLDAVRKQIEQFRLFCIKARDSVSLLYFIKKVR